MSEKHSTIKCEKITKIIGNMALETTRRNIIIPMWVENGLQKLADKRGVKITEYVQDLLKAHVSKGLDLDEFGNEPKRKN